MPWCPECRTEYRPGFDRCSGCGAALVGQDVHPPARPAVPAGTIESALGAGCLSWVIGFFVLMGGVALIPSTMPLVGAFARTAVPGTVGLMGFAAGYRTRHRFRFMQALIGWLLVSVPVLSMAGLGYAHDTGTPLALANAIWSLLLSPVIVGPLSMLAGSRYSIRHNRAIVLITAAGLLILIAGFAIVFALIPLPTE